MEGATKVREGGFSSVGFLGAAKGPLAPNFHAMIPDFDGRTRLERDRIYAAYQAYVERVKNRYSFNEEQVQKADAAFVDAIVRWDAIAGGVRLKFDGSKNLEPAIVAGNSPRKSKSTFRASKEFRTWLMTANERTWSRFGSSATKSKRNGELWSNQPWRRSIPAPRSSKNDCERLRPVSQVRNIGEIPFDLDTGVVSVRWIDRIIPIFDMSVGILLILAC